MSVGNLPLSALLSRSLLDLDRTFEAPGPDGAPTPQIVLWSNLLRVLRDGPISRRDLPKAARVSRRTMSSLVAGAQRLQLIEVQATGPRTADIALTSLGEVVHDSWAPLIRRAEDAWRLQVGADAMDRLRAALAALVGRLDLELPHHPIGYGPADLSMRGGREIGTDWKPVPRESPAHVEDLSLLALLSQALVAFAMDHEGLDHWPLAVTVNLLSRLGDGTPLADLPALAGITGAGTSFTERHGAVVVTDGIGRLTPKGRGHLDRYLPCAQEVEQTWTARWGEVVPELRAALEAVDPTIPADRAHFPLVAYVGVTFSEITPLLDEMGKSK
jgi:hypothetical protein